MLPIRVRLTLWYVLVMLAGVALFGVASYAMLRYALLQEKKTHLLGRETRLNQLVEENQAQHVAASLDQQLANYALVTHEGNMFELRRPDGTLFFPAGTRDSVWNIGNPPACQERSFQVIWSRNEPVMVMCHAITIHGMDLRLYVGSSLEQQYGILHTYCNSLLILFPGLLILCASSGYFLSKQAMDPVDRITKAALGIGIGNLSGRLPVPPTHDEVQHLAEAWNQLLARLEAAILRLSQFSADISHDLRTSITVMLATAQLALQRSHSEQEYRADLSRIVSECCTAASLLDAQLSLVQSKNYMHEVELSRVDLTGLVLNGCRRAEDLAEAHGILLDWDLPAEAVFIDGNELLLQRLLGILLDNAIKYTQEGGSIHASVSVRGNEAVIEVRDTGIGIAPEAQGQIFERYYQGNLRERKTQAGCGLGLSIARWIADAHRARIALRSVPHEGSTFEIRFPLAQERQPVEPLEQMA